MNSANQTRRYPARLLATGQTTVYVTGDNGTNQTGRAKRYTILTTGQYSGTTNITINSKTDAHSNNCVVDLETGRMWSRTVAASVGSGSNGKLPWTSTGSGATLEGIFPFALAANSALLAGYSDWRIPSDIELVSLRDMEQPTAAPDATTFPSWPTSDNFWSSGTRPDNTLNGVALFFLSGNIAVGSAKSGNNYFVALVRG